MKRYIGDVIDPEKLRREMRARKIKGQDLAQRAGCSRITISRIRNGRQGTSRDLAGRIAAALGVDLAELRAAAEGTGESFQTASSAEAREVVAQMSRMSPSDRRIVWAFVKGLTASGSLEPAAAADELESAARQAERAAEEREGTRARGA